MTQALLVLVVALTVGAIVFGITVLIGGDDDGLRPVEPDGRSRPLPNDRPLTEADLQQSRFDTAVRGYRMTQVDAAMRRAGYDIGYKDELVRVLQAEVDALREGRFPDAEVLRRAREASAAPVAGDPVPAEPPAAEPVGGDPVGGDLVGGDPVGGEPAVAAAPDDPVPASSAASVPAPPSGAPGFSPQLVVAAADDPDGPVPDPRDDPAATEVDPPGAADEATAEPTGEATDEAPGQTAATGRR